MGIFARSVVLGATSFAAASVILTLMGVSSVPAQTQQQKDWCANENRSIAAERRIDSCTALIQSGHLGKRDLAIAFTYRGDAYNDRHDYDRAIADLDQAIRNDPSYAMAYGLRGITYGEKGDFDHAISDFTEAIQIDPKYGWAYNNRGYAYYNKRDYDRAIADYDEAIWIDSNNKSAIKNRALAIKEKDRGGSKNEGHPNDAVALRNRGDAYAKKGDYNRAMAAYTDAIRIDPKYAAAYKLRGLMYEEVKHDPERAIADYNEAIRLDPSNSQAFDLRGQAYVAKGGYDRAIADYTEALRLSEKDFDIFFHRSLAYFNNGDYDRAIADLDGVIRLDPNRAGAEAFRMRGYAYAEKGDFDHAIADHTEAARVAPKYYLPYSDRGTAYLAKGNYDHAIADFNKAIELNPKNFVGYIGRGVANLYSGALAKARTDLKQATSLAPQNAYAALWFDVANKRNQLPSQLAAATKNINRSEWPAQIVDLYLGRLTFEATFAAADSQDIAEKRSRLCTANYFGGALLLQRGDKEGAKRLFQAAVAVCPKYFDAWWASQVELKALNSKGT